MEYASVLITAYNRPASLKSLISALKDFPCRIYVAVDGAKEGDSVNEELVRQAREVIASNKEHLSGIRISPKNQGCFVGVSNAISWGFTNESRLIILEEDIEVGEAFLIFATQMLEQFEDSKDIGSIAGMNFVPGESISNPEASIRFSAYTSSWGWATWRDRWRQYEEDLRNFPEMVFDRPKNFWNLSKRHYWSEVFSDVSRGATDSWAYRWLYSNWKNNRLTIIPNENLALNIGFGEGATHTRDQVLPWWLPRTVVNSFRALSIPSTPERDQLADRWMEKNHFRTGPIQQLRRGLSKRFPRLGELYRHLIKRR